MFDSGSGSGSLSAVGSSRHLGGESWYVRTFGSSTLLTMGSSRHLGGEIWSESGSGSGSLSAVGSVRVFLLAIHSHLNGF